MKSLVRITLALALAAAPAAADDAATTYKDKCVACHGPDGKAQTAKGKKLHVKDWTDGKTLNEMSDAAVGTEIQSGKQLMPGFDSLADAPLAALIVYIRTFQK